MLRCVHQIWSLRSKDSSDAMQAAKILHLILARARAATDLSDAVEPNLDIYGAPTYKNNQPDGDPLHHLEPSSTIDMITSSPNSDSDMNVNPSAYEDILNNANLLDWVCSVFSLTLQSTIQVHISNHVY